MLELIAALAALTVVEASAEEVPAPEETHVTAESLAEASAEAALYDRAAMLAYSGRADAVRISEAQHGQDGLRWRRGHGYGYGYGRGYRRGYGQDRYVRHGHADKDARRRAGRFGLPDGGVVSMPPPRGGLGRVTAQALEEAEAAGGLAVDGAASAPESGQPVVPATDTAGAAGTATGTPSGAASPPASGEPDAAALQRGSAVRLSLAKDARPAASQGTDTVATPVPPSLILFASGLGLFGLSRRPVANA